MADSIIEKAQTDSWHYPILLVSGKVINASLIEGPYTLGGQSWFNIELENSDLKELGIKESVRDNITLNASSICLIADSAS